MRATDGPRLSINTAKPREVIPLPSPVPIIHSTAFIQSNMDGSPDLEDSPAAVKVHGAHAQSLSTRQQKVTPSDDGGLMGALKSIDEHLQTIEDEPNPLHQKLYDLSHGPMGEAAGRGLQTAADVTLRAGESLVPVIRRVVSSPGVTRAAGWVVRTGVEASKAIGEALLVEAAKRLVGESKGKSQGKGESQR